MKISKQSESKTKRKTEKRKQKYHKTTRNLVSGDSPEMRFFVLKRKKEEKESAIDSLGVIWKPRKQAVQRLEKKNKNRKERGKSA